jgi:hypothetical protein
MSLSDCIECWSTPCECGHEFKNSSSEYKEIMTKSINGFTINDVFQWLAKKNYLTDDPEIIKKEMINDFESK